jgi:hypothetical protein
MAEAEPGCQPLELRGLSLSPFVESINLCVSVVLQTDPSAKLLPLSDLLDCFSSAVLHIQRRDRPWQNIRRLRTLLAPHHWRPHTSIRSHEDLNLNYNTTRYSWHRLFAALLALALLFMVPWALLPPDGKCAEPLPTGLLPLVRPLMVSSSQSWSTVL